MVCRVHIITLLSFGFTCTSSTNIIETFLKVGLYDHLITCDSNLINDEFNFEMLEISNKYQVDIEIWNCSNSTITLDTNNALIFLNDPQPTVLANLLNQKGSQRTLKSSTWLIHTKDETKEIKDYFIANGLKIGLNANIFMVKGMGENMSLYQGLGDGTIRPQSKVTDQGYFKILPHLVTICFQ